MIKVNEHHGIGGDFEELRSFHAAMEYEKRLYIQAIGHFPELFPRYQDYNAPWEEMAIKEQRPPTLNSCSISSNHPSIRPLPLLL